MKRKIMIWTIGMGLSAAVMAQEPLSLHACMEYAVAHSTKKIIQDASYADALIERRDAILKAFTPTVSAGTYAYSNFGRAVDPESKHLHQQHFLQQWLFGQWKYYFV